MIKVDDLIHILENSGAGCTCYAYGSCECGCGAAWAENHRRQTVEVIRSLQAEIFALKTPKTLRGISVLVPSDKLKEMQEEIEYWKTMFEKAMRENEK